MKLYFDLNGEPIEKPATYRTFRREGGVRTANLVAPSDSGTPVTREEYEALRRDVTELRSLVSGLIKQSKSVQDESKTVQPVQPVQDETKADRPWVELGISKSGYYAKKKAGLL